jgi:hypothetical protein
LDEEININIPDDEKKTPDSIRSGEGINIIRQKTFNAELQSLVNRIKQNEGPAIPGQPEEQIKPADALRKLHELFYMTKNLLNLDASISKNIDPREIYKSSPVIDFHVLRDAVKKAMAASGLHGFAYMLFEPEEKCYRPSITDLPDDESADLLIGRMDPILDEIFESEKGIILERSRIKGDEFLSRKFNPGKSDYTGVYLVCSERISSAAYRDISGSANDPRLYPPPPVLAVKILLHNEIEIIYGIIRKNLSLLLLLMEKFIYSGSLLKHAGLLEKYRVIDYIISTFDKKDEIRCLRIKTVSSKINESSFIVNYLLSKLTEILRESSAVIHVSSTSIIIFSGPEDFDILTREINKLNYEFGDILLTEMIKRPVDSNSIIKLLLHK